MITGFNTDIEFDGIVYHVQTEDKGVSTPVIMSLVYDRGIILASKRASYEDLINGTVNEEAVAERLQRQHKLICAAVSAGRIEDLKQMSARNMKEAAAKRNARKKSTKAAAEPDPVEPAPEIAVPQSVPEPEPVEIAVDAPAAPSAPALPDTIEIKAGSADAEAVTQQEEKPVWPGPETQSTNSIPDTIPYFRLEEVLDPSTKEPSPIAKPSFEPLPEPVKPDAPITQQPVIEEANIVTDEPVMIPLDAVEAVSDLAGTERPENHKLNIDIIGENRFKGGEQRVVCIMVCRGSTRKVVPRAEVMVKLLGSEFRPVIYHAVTDKNGVATINVKVPGFQSGRASLIARAISEGEEVEVRSAVAHG